MTKFNEPRKKRSRKKKDVLDEKPVQPIPFPRKTVEHIRQRVHARAKHPMNE